MDMDVDMENKAQSSSGQAKSGVVSPFTAVVAATRWRFAACPRTLPECVCVG